MVRSTSPKKVPPKRKAPVRQRFLSDADVARIVEIVRHWPRTPMTWEAIRTVVARDLLGQAQGRPSRAAPAAWSRQALSKHPGIKKAYAERRQELAVQNAKEPRRRAGARDPETVVLRRQVEGLQIEVKTLKERIAAYEDRFRAMLVNRARGETTEVGLLEPLADKMERRQVKE